MFSAASHSQFSLLTSGLSAGFGQAGGDTQPTIATPSTPAQFHKEAEQRRIRSNDRAPQHEQSDHSIQPNTKQVKDWTKVPISTLTNRLTLRKGGARVIRVIARTHLATIADVLAVTDEQWLQCRNFGMGSLAILHQELMLLSDSTYSQELESSSIPVSRKSKPLDDVLWFPRTWTELQGLMRDDGRRRLESIPIAGLVRNLTTALIGYTVVNAIIARGCHTVADVLSVDGPVWLTYPNMNGITLNLLMLKTTDYVHANWRIMELVTRLHRFRAYARGS